MADLRQRDAELRANGTVGRWNLTADSKTKLIRGGSNGPLLVQLLEEAGGDSGPLRDVLNCGAPSPLLLV